MYDVDGSNLLDDLSQHWQFLVQTVKVDINVNS